SPGYFPTLSLSPWNPVALSFERVRRKIHAAARVIPVKAAPVDRHAPDIERCQGLEQLLPIRLSRTQARQPNLMTVVRTLLPDGGQSRSGAYFHENLVALFMQRLQAGGESHRLAQMTRQGNRGRCAC